MKSDYSSYSISKDVKLPENSTAIVDMCPMSISLSKGFAVLYKIQGWQEDTCSRVHGLMLIQVKLELISLELRSTTAKWLMSLIFLAMTNVGKLPT